jgi:hypothetical protein
MQHHNSLNPHGIILILLLILQYILGMMTNMFVKFPDSGTPGQFWEFAWRQLPLALHIIVGTLLILGSIVLVVRAIRVKNTTWIIASSVGCLAILVAGSSGASFIPTPKDLYSFMMAIAFIVAFVAFAWGLYASKNSDVTSK